LKPALRRTSKKGRGSVKDRRPQKKNRPPGATIFSGRKKRKGGGTSSGVHARGRQGVPSKEKGD